jgi:hypothetical protein
VNQDERHPMLRDFGHQPVGDVSRPFGGAAGTRARTYSSARSRRVPSASVRSARHPRRSWPSRRAGIALPHDLAGQGATVTGGTAIAVEPLDDPSAVHAHCRRPRPRSARDVECVPPGSETACIEP